MKFAWRYTEEERQNRLKEWNYWYAWRPVLCVEDGIVHIVWLQTVKRRLYYSVGPGFDWFQYGFIKEPTEKELATGTDELSLEMEKREKIIRECIHVLEEFPYVKARLMAYRAYRCIVKEDDISR